LSLPAGAMLHSEERNMRSLGSAVASIALAAFVVGCGSSGAGGGDDTPQLRDGDSVAAKGGTRAISANELKALRSGSCSNWNATPQPLPSSLMMVVDVSSSMQSSTSSTNGRSKWDVTREALVNALDSLPASTQVGLLLYPNMNAEYNVGGPALDASRCVNSGAMVGIQTLGDAGSRQRSALNNALQRARLGAGTPTHDAFWLALNAFADSGLTGNGFAVVITDGEPTLSRGCIAGGLDFPGVDPEPIIAEALNASNKGIHTFFIGSPGSEANERGTGDARPWLSRAARAGGTSYVGCSDDGPNYCHFDMTAMPDFSAALNDALAQIAGSVVQCGYPIPAPPEGQTFDPDMVNMVYTASDGQSVVILRNDQANCEVGWQYTKDRTSIVLCSQTCGAAAEDIGAYVELFFGCETETAII
jgi:hypothetical protein